MLPSSSIWAFFHSLLNRGCSSIDIIHTYIAMFLLRKMSHVVSYTSQKGCLVSSCSARVDREPSSATPRQGWNVCTTYFPWQRTNSSTQVIVIHVYIRIHTYYGCVFLSACLRCSWEGLGPLHFLKPQQAALETLKIPQACRRRRSSPRSAHGGQLPTKHNIHGVGDTKAKPLSVGEPRSPLEPGRKIDRVYEHRCSVHEEPCPSAVCVSV